MTRNYAELRRGKVRWYFVTRSGANGKVLSTSQHYWSKWNAKRAAKATGLPVR